MKPASRSDLAAECHRLYALLHPKGRVQVMVPPNERAQMEARYRAVYAELAKIDEDAAEAQATVADYIDEVEASIPQLVGMLPVGSEWRGRIERIMQMDAGQARDDALRDAFNKAISGEALQRLGPLGAIVGPMVQSFLNKSSTRRRGQKRRR